MSHDAPLKIIAFPGAPNLPLFAALEHGFFADERIGIDFETTPSSVQQIKQFAAGAYDIAFTAFDNVVAYRENQGAAALPDTPDFRVLMGATQIELSFVVATHIRSFADLKGRSLALDAVATGFAFVLYDMLERSGLKQGDYDLAAVGATPERWQSVKDGTHVGTITIEPFTSIARAAGFRVLASSTDFFPAYQGGIVAVRNDWAAGNADRARAFIRGYLKGLRWTLDPDNRAAASALLLARMPNIKPAFVEAVMTSLLSPRSGLTPGGDILRDGMQAVLALRSRYGRPQRQLSDIDKYLALALFEQARGGV